MSKLLEFLNAQIAQAQDAASRAEYRARKAGYLARLGSFDEAQSLISDLRQDFGAGQSPRVSIWIMLAEGMLHTFRDMSDVGADRIMRAHALASVTRDRALISVTSAWRAFTQSERSEFKGMVRSLEDALVNADSSDHEVLARVYMILANARMSIGDRAAAYELYMYSKHHALECGDHATIDALLYNKPAFAVAWLRARACFGDFDAEHLRQLRLELNSAKSYQQLASVSALKNFVFLWEARLLLLSKEHQAAIAALQAVRSMQPFARYNYHEAVIDLEVSYCMVQQNDLVSAESQMRGALSADLSGLHDDDKLFAAWLRVRLLEALPHLGDLSTAQTALEQVRDEFAAGCDALRLQLDGLGEHAHIVRPTVVHPKARA